MKVEAQPLFGENPQMASHSPLYGICERIFRAAFFQFAVQRAGWIEQLLIYIYRCFERRDCAPSFDEERMDRSLEIFKKLGAKEHEVTPEDGKAKIHMITMRASDLEALIKQKGGQWKKLDNEFMIVPPKMRSEDWKTFEQECLLNKTGWTLHDRLVDGEIRRVIVTCKDADLVQERGQKCFLHIHYPFIRQRQRAGFYLGMKKDCCFYDERGVRNSLGTPSEKGCYLAADAVFKQLEWLGYSTPDIWVSGSCKTASIGAFLKKKYHRDGINFVAEQSYVDLETEMLDQQMWLVRYFAKWNLNALSCRDIPEDIAPEVTEDHFNTQKKWETLPLSRKGKVVIIQAKDDNTLPKDAEKRYFHLAQKANTQAFLRYFDVPKGVNGHNVSCLGDKNMRRELLKIVYDRVKPDPSLQPSG